MSASRYPTLSNATTLTLEAPTGAPPGAPRSFGVVVGRTYTLRVDGEARVLDRGVPTMVSTPLSPASPLVFKAGTSQVFVAAVAGPVTCSLLPHDEE